LTTKLYQRSLCLIVGIFICLFAWGVFLSNLDTRSIYQDERYSWEVAQQDALGVTRETATDVHPPLYYLWLSAWMRFSGGQQLFVLRLSATIPALLAIALLYRLALRWFDKVWVATSATIFLTTSGLFINYARDLRMYSLIACLSILSWWFLEDAIRHRRRIPLGYIATVALMAFTYYYAAFVVLAQGAYLLLFHRQTVTRWFRSLLAVGFAFSVWIPSFINQLGIARSQSGDQNAPLLGKFLGTRPTDLEALSELFQTYSAHQISWLALLLLLTAATFTESAAPHRARLGAALSWLVLALLIFFGINLIIPVYGLRYTLPLFPALAILVGVGVLAFKSPVLRAVMIALIAIVGLITQVNGYQSPRASHRALLQMVADGYQPGDRIWYLPPLLARGSGLWDEAIYHLRTEFTMLSTDWFVWDAPHDFENLANTPRVWDIRDYWIPILEEAVVPLQEGRVISQQATFDNASYLVRLYEAPPLNEAPIRYPQGLGLRFGVIDIAQRDDETLLIPRLWWQLYTPILQDLSYTLLLMNDDETVVASKDDSLILGGTPTAYGLEVAAGTSGIPTSQWQMSAHDQLMTPLMSLPSNLPAGHYTLWIGVYYWQQPTLITPLTTENYYMKPTTPLVQIGELDL